MDQKVDKIVKLYDGDVLLVFSDGTGMVCQSPTVIDANGVKQMVRDEMEMIRDSYSRFVELDTISKAFKQEEAEIAAEGESNGESGLADEEFAEPTGDEVGA